MQIGTIRTMMSAAALALGSTGALASPAFAQTSEPAQLQQEDKLASRAADIVAMLNGEKPPEELISPEFLASVSAEQFAQFGEQLTAQFGPALGVESVEPTNANGARIMLRFEKALVGGPMTVDASPPHLVSGLLLNDITPLGDAGPDTISADLDALGGMKAAWFGPLEGEPIYSYGDPDRQFALGSAFKLYVLAALSRAVNEGRLAWDDVVTLDAKSYPSGVMQDWPDGAPVTLHTAATLMISISDNTATDLVIDAGGREAVEAEMRASGHADPGKSFPLLTTRELFTIKAGEIAPAYAAASEAERRAMLGTLAQEAPSLERVMAVFSSGEPVLIEEIEWFASMRDELALMRVLAALPDDTAREIMAVNNVLGEKAAAEWDYVGFKGGSETGVLNMSWLLRDAADEWHMLAISQMDPSAEVDTTALLMIAKRILALAE